MNKTQFSLSETLANQFSPLVVFLFFQQSCGYLNLPHLFLTFTETPAIYQDIGGLVR
jgi:hypothetical protein